MKLAALALLAAVAVPAKVDAGYQTPIKLGAKGQAVVEVEYRLKAAGYSVVVDQTFDKRTDRAVRHFQRASGLEVDGVVGKLTLAALVAATATRPAVRVTPPAPQFADDCAEARYYRVAAGLPEVFDAIAYRESRCQNDAANWCCYGWYQHFLSSHLSRQSAYRERIINECGVTTVADIRGLSDAQKRASACVTYVVWSISGMSPWRLG